jgi:anti-sigma factor RsiW
MKSKQKNKSCPGDGIIQSYLDHELSKEDTAALKAHLLSCPSCRERQNRQKARIKKFKQGFKDIVSNEIDVPEFNPQKTKKEDRAKTLLQHWKWAAAAILILGFVFVFNRSHKPGLQENQYLIYEANSEIDANKPWHEQDMCIYIIENGQVLKEIF